MAIGCDDIETPDTPKPPISQNPKTVMYITIYEKLCNTSIANGKKRIITCNVLNEITIPTLHRVPDLLGIRPPDDKYLQDGRRVELTGGVSGLRV